MESDKRMELDLVLREVLGSDNVYFQPPENTKIDYPCVIYARNYANARYADNNTYSFKYRYQITYIDREPDSDFPERLIQRLPMCVYDRPYTADNLNHEVLNVYY